MPAKAQTKIVLLQPGLYALGRDAEMNAPSPLLIPQPVPRGDGLSGAPVQIAGPLREGVVALSANDQLAAIHVEDRAAEIMLTLYIPEGYPAREVKIQLRRVDREGDAADGIAQSPARGPSPAAPLPVGLEGHIEDIGDISVEAGRWLGDPKGRMRIEGFRALWPDRPRDVDLQASCVVEGLGRISGIRAGGFVGTRRRAAPIAAVRFDLVEAMAGQYRLEVEAAFSRSGVLRGGNGDELAGSGGDDFLTALRLTVMGPGGAAASRIEGEQGQPLGYAPIATGPGWEQVEPAPATPATRPPPHPAGPGGIRTYIAVD